MAQKNPQQVAQKWAQNLGQATTAITQGVAAVTVNPSDKAAANEQGYLAGVQRAVQSGKWRRGLQSSSLQNWQQTMTQKGIPRIGTGAAAATGKFANFMGQLLNYQQAGLSQLPPRGDINANLARMMAWAQYMSNFKKQPGA